MIKLATAVGLGVALLSAPVRCARAQATPADTAGVLYQTARRVQDEGNESLARAIFTLITRAYPGTPAAAAAVQQLAAWHQAIDSTGGRVELMVWGTIYGAWLGLGIPAALGADSPEPFGGGLLAGAPSGLLAARAYGRMRPLSVGQAKLIRFASIWGTWQGIGWRDVLNLGDQSATYCVPSGGGCFTQHYGAERAPYTFAVLGGLAGIGTAMAITAHHQVTSGTATVIEFSGYWGTWFGAAGSVVLGLTDDDLLALTLGTGDAAVLAASVIAPGRHMSGGRARLISAAGLAGVAAGLGVDLLANVDDEHVAFGIPMATSLAGLAIGAAATRDYDGLDREAPDAGSSALLNVRGGRIGLALPIPWATVLVRGFDGTRVRSTPGLRIQLLEALF